MPILKVFNKMSVEVSPGVIQANVQSKGRSVKLKAIQLRQSRESADSETFEMVIVVKSSKQTFKVYGKDQGMIVKALEEFKKDNWNVQGVLDISR